MQVVQHTIDPDRAVGAPAREREARTGARERLEAIIHPLVSQEAERQAAHAQQAGAPLIVFDVPLLVESGARWRARVDRVMVIECDAETQIQRVMARNQLAREEVERILVAQASQAQRLACADAVIFNGAGTELVQLRAQVSEWAQRFGL